MRKKYEKMSIESFCNSIKAIKNESTNERLDSNQINPHWLLQLWYEDFETVLFKNGTVRKIVGVYYCGSDIQIEYE